MLNDFKDDVEVRMKKSIDALKVAFNKIRTGRAHPNILESIKIDYYGSKTPLSQVSNISVEDMRTLSVTPWEKNMVPDIEKAIMKSDLGLNPVTAGSVIRVPMPALTEETRKGYIRQARKEAENSRISVRNIRRDILTDIKKLLKEKEISEDDLKKKEKVIQDYTDNQIKVIDDRVLIKEKEIMTI